MLIAVKIDWFPVLLLLFTELCETHPWGDRGTAAERLWERPSADHLGL